MVPIAARLLLRARRSRVPVDHDNHDNKNINHDNDKFDKRNNHYQIKHHDRDNLYHNNLHHGILSICVPGWSTSIVDRKKEGVVL